MEPDNINSDTLTVKDGEWGQVAGMINGGHLVARRIIVETDSGTIELDATPDFDIRARDASPKED